MRNLLLAAALVAFPAAAQVQISVQLPSIFFPAPPQLVVVQPGVQVVENNSEEVFVVDDVYWVRRSDRWYRANDHRGGWVYVDGPRVPPSLVRLSPGAYRHDKHEQREERREDRREDRRDEGKGNKHGKGKH